MHLLNLPRVDDSAFDSNVLLESLNSSDKRERENHANQKGIAHLHTTESPSGQATMTLWTDDNEPSLPKRLECGISTVVPSKAYLADTKLLMQLANMDEASYLKSLLRDISTVQDKPSTKGEVIQQLWRAVMLRSVDDTGLAAFAADIEAIELYYGHRWLFSQTDPSENAITPELEAYYVTLAWRCATLYLPPRSRAASLLHRGNRNTDQLSTFSVWACLVALLAWRALATLLDANSAARISITSPQSTAARHRLSRLRTKLANTVIPSRLDYGLHRAYRSPSAGLGDLEDLLYTCRDTILSVEYSTPQQGYPNRWAWLKPRGPRSPVPLVALALHHLPQEATVLRSALYSEMWRTLNHVLPPSLSRNPHPSLLQPRSSSAARDAVVCDLVQRLSDACLAQWDLVFGKEWQFISSSTMTQDADSGGNSISVLANASSPSHRNPLYCKWSIVTNHELVLLTNMLEMIACGTTDEQTTTFPSSVAEEVPFEETSEKIVSSEGSVPAEYGDPLPVRTPIILRRVQKEADPNRLRRWATLVKLYLRLCAMLPSTQQYTQNFGFPPVLLPQSDNRPSGSMEGILSRAEAVTSGQSGSTEDTEPNGTRTPPQRLQKSKLAGGGQVGGGGADRRDSIRPLVLKAMVLILHYLEQEFGAMKYEYLDLGSNNQTTMLGAVADGLIAMHCLGQKCEDQDLRLLLAGMIRCVSTQEKLGCYATQGSAATRVALIGLRTIRTLICEDTHKCCDSIHQLVESSTCLRECMLGRSYQGCEVEDGEMIEEIALWRTALESHPVQDCCLLRSTFGDCEGATTMAPDGGCWAAGGRKMDTMCAKRIGVRCIPLSIGTVVGLMILDCVHLAAALYLEFYLFEWRIQRLRHPQHIVGRVIRDSMEQHPTFMLIMFVRLMFWIIILPFCGR